MFTEYEALVWASLFPRVDVLLLHAPPANLLDYPDDPVHKGSLAVRDYVLMQQPRAVLCGHVHSNAQLVVGGTTIYRTYGGRLLDI